MTTETTEKYVVFETDMGADDAWALQMLLKAEKHLKNVKVLAITIVNGNTTVENSIKNTYRILDGLDRTDIPIYKGATEALIPGELKRGTWYGGNGFCDVDFWDTNVYPSDVKTLVQPKHAVEIIRDLILEHPHKISLICLAPLTNIALAVKTYPEIRDKICEIFIMGGNFQGVGNTTSCAEFNFYIDPEAVHIVLETVTCPIIILPWECCLEENLLISTEWRFKTFEHVKCKNVALFNEIDEIAYKDCDSFAPCDAYLTAAFLFPEKCILTKRQYHATIELQGAHTRGQVVLDHNRRNKHNITMIQTMNEEEVKNALILAGTPQ
ncbi:inosine-uridine preferring nucleoside hydrolase-like isoform X2 [Contarinia nasturtii]|nr:inosine-uridine preferring nucleoside hydrolase-like isoform X2 [Contarinia nasturtii]XP_031628267.1 inosine-uridine preferring nucleoside hydrolase-like isoform X2 [Contarinia nasturtii]XP_031628268.1 inosine-uridine preferring nucleoside hydrolase-like isoform X2 [Contarinia nasturtii]